MSQTVRASISLTVLFCALLALQLHSAGEAVPIRKALDSFPARLGDWQERGGTILDTDILNELKLTDYVMRDYADGSGRDVSLYVGYWDTQRKGAAIHTPKNCLPGAGWDPIEASLVTIPLRPPHPPIIVNRYVIEKDREQQVVLYWYQSQGEAIAGEIPARMAMVKSAILRNRTDGALVRVMSPVHESIQETADRLVRYVQALYPALGDYLPD